MMDLDWSIIVRNWPVLLSGFANTLKLAVLAMAASFSLGVVAGALRLSRS